MNELKGVFDDMIAFKKDISKRNIGVQASSKN